MAAWGLVVSAAAGQTAPPPEGTAGVPPIFTSPAAAADSPPAPVTPAVAPAEGTHVLSPALAAAISTALRPYAAPDTAAPAAVPGPAAEPRNKVPRLPIVTLPKVTVRDRPIREFTERESYTKEGLRELAAKRYLSWLDHLLYNQGIPGFMTPEGLAMAKYHEAEDHARAREMADLQQLDAMKDPDQKPPAQAP